MDMRRVMNRRLFFTLLFFGTVWWASNCSAVFTSLSEAQSYAKNNPEYVKPSKDNWVHPDFDFFHKEYVFWPGLSTLFHREIAQDGS